MTAPSPGSTVTSPTVWCLCVSKRGTGKGVFFFVVVVVVSGTVYFFYLKSQGNLIASVISLLCSHHWTGVLIYFDALPYGLMGDTPVSLARHNSLILLSSFAFCLNCVLFINCWPRLWLALLFWYVKAQKKNVFPHVPCQGWHFHLAVFIIDPYLNLSL